MVIATVVALALIVAALVVYATNSDLFNEVVLIVLAAVAFIVARVLWDMSPSSPAPK